MSKGRLPPGMRFVAAELKATKRLTALMAVAESQPAAGVVPLAAVAGHADALYDTG
jgi:hypothetical protein